MKIPFITALTSFRHLSLSWANPIQSTYPHPTSWRSILILSTHLRLGLPSGLFPSGFPTKTLMLYREYNCRLTWAGIAKSVERLTAGWDIESQWGQDFPHPSRQSVRPASLLRVQIGYRVMAGVKRPDPGFSHPLPPRIEITERLQQYLYSPSGLPW